MSEKLSKGAESLSEKIDTSAESEKNLERLRDAAKQAEKDPLQAHVESLQQSAEQQAVSGKELNVGDTTGESSGQTFGIDKALKADGYKRSLRKIRSSLTTPERAFSRVIHNPVVESVSNTTAKTVARPSAFLGGSMGALIGSTTLLFMAKRYGFTYNYSVFLILFVGGFAAGLLIELLLRVVFKRKSS